VATLGNAAPPHDDITATVCHTASPLYANPDAAHAAAATPTRRFSAHISSTSACLAQHRGGGTRISLRDLYLRAYRLAIHLADGDRLAVDVPRRTRTEHAAGALVLLDVAMRLVHAVHAFAVCFAIPLPCPPLRFPAWLPCPPPTLPVTRVTAHPHLLFDTLPTPHHAYIHSLPTPTPCPALFTTRTCLPGYYQPRLTPFYRPHLVCVVR